MALPSSPSSSSFSPPRTPSHRPHRLSLPLNSSFEPFHPSSPPSSTPASSHHPRRLVDDSPLDPSSFVRAPHRPETQFVHIAPRSSANLLDVLSLDAVPVRASRTHSQGVAIGTASPTATRTRRVGSSSSDQVSPNVVAMTTPSTPPTGPRGDTEIEHLRPLSAFNPSPLRTSSSAPTSPGSSPGSPTRSPSTSSQSHANSPPVDTSFMRWSKTASTIFSEAPSSHFYFNKRSTGTFSDFAPSPEKLPRLPAANTTNSKSKSKSNSDSLSSSVRKGDHAKEESDETTGTGSSPNHHNPDGKRESAGTFGSRQRRWSEANSGGHGMGGQDESTPRLGQSFWDDEEEGSYKSPSTGLRRRPRSMSSTSDSTPSASVSGAEVSSAQLHRANPQAGSGYFPSPTQRRVSHKKPESEREITAHLIKTSSRNDLRIVPRSRPPPLGLSLAGGIMSPAPPSSGTPLNAGGVREESIYGDSGESDLGDLGLGWGTSLVRAASKRKTGKLDQMLGEGAETARVLMEFERRAIENAVQTSQGQQPPPRPLPPPRGHKPSASMPSMTVPSTPTTPLRLYDHSEHLATYSPTHGRSGSLDSLPSLHPSPSESVTTLSRLLPSSSSVPPVPSLPRPSARTALFPLPPLSSRNDLLPGQRAVLIRRARKIEQVLGEPLPESQVERLVVEPSHASTTVVTSINHEWPETPSPRGRVPEWDQEDCVPRTVRHGPEEMPIAMARSTSNPNPGSGVLSGGNLVRSGSTFAKKAKAALRRDKKEDESTALKVYVAREMRVVETTVRGGSSEAVRPRINRQEWTDPASPTGPLSPGSPTDTLDQRSEEEDRARRTTRQQLAKLHRLLGVPIPASLVTQAASSDDLPLHSLSGQAAVGGRHSDSPSDLSFMMFDEPGTAASSWASRLRSTVTPKSSKDKDKERKGKLSSSPPFPSSSFSLLSNRISSRDGDVTRDESCRDGLNSLASESDLGAAAGMSDKQKAVARRKAAKLEQVFGDPPPQAMYLASHRPSMSVNLSRDMPATSFPTPPTHLPPTNEIGNGRNGTTNAKGEYQTYHDSLQNLLHLVETDRARLTSIVDSLEPSNSSRNGEPTAAGQSDIGATGGTRRVRGQVLNNGAGHSYTSSVESRMTTDRGTSSPPSPALRSPPVPARQQSPQINNHDHIQSDSDHDDDDDSERHHKGAADDGVDVDVDVGVGVGFDPNSRAARRKRTGKLTSFFGESSINFADPHPPPAPGFGFSAYPNEPDHSAASLFGNGHGQRSGNGSGSGSGSGSRSRKGPGNQYGIGNGIGNGKGSIRRKRMTRIETLDNVLGEMWRGVQAEMRRGGLGLEEGRKLGEMMGTLRRRSGGVWEEI